MRRVVSYEYDKDELAAALRLRAARDAFEKAEHKRITEAMHAIRAGLSDDAIAVELRVSRQTVWRWRRRYL